MGSIATRHDGRGTRGGHGGRSVHNQPLSRLSRLKKSAAQEDEAGRQEAAQSPTALRWIMAWMTGYTRCALQLGRLLSLPPRCLSGHVRAAARAAGHEGRAGDGGAYHGGGRGGVREKRGSCVVRRDTLPLPGWQLQKGSSQMLRCMLMNGAGPAAVAWIDARVAGCRFVRALSEVPAARPARSWLDAFASR